MNDHTEALRDVDATLARIAEQLVELGRRQAKMIWIGTLAIVTGIVSVVVISTLVYVNSDQIKAQNRVICPSVAILASTDPPRTTPAGREQAAEAQRLLRGPAFTACR